MKDIFNKDIRLNKYKNKVIKMIDIGSDIFLLIFNTLLTKRLIPKKDNKNKNIFRYIINNSCLNYIINNI